MWDNPTQLNRLSKYLLILLVIALLSAGWTLLKQSSWFPVKGVKVVGNLQNVTKQQVQLVVDNTVPGNFFSVELDSVHQAFESLAWVDRVSIKRDWASRLIVVSVLEHQPLARWGRTALMSQRGKLFEAVIDQTLPTLSGPEQSEGIVFKQYIALRRLLRTADLEIAQLSLSDRFSWQLQTGKVMTVEIGSAENPVESMGKFIEIYRQSVGDWHGKIEYVDLRYRDGFAIKKPVEA